MLLKRVPQCHAISLVTHALIVSLSYIQQPNYDPYHRYPLSSTQRCWTYKSHIAHAHVRLQCSVVTDIWGNAADVRWLGLRGYPFALSHFLITTAAKHCSQKPSCKSFAS